MRVILAFLVALLVASPSLGAGDDTTLPAPVTETKASVRWQVSKLFVDRKTEVPMAIVIVSGRSSDGEWIQGTDTELRVFGGGTEILGYAVVRAGVSNTCAVRLSQLFSQTATGYTINTKTLLTTCLGGS